jgi:DNA-binding CsgD family transcriptional regulator
LTGREKEVLRLIADGMTNNEIAHNLFISATTVDTHRKNLLTKFDAKNTALLIRMAAQMQII